MAQADTAGKKGNPIMLQLDQYGYPAGISAYNAPSDQWHPLRHNQALVTHRGPPRGS